LTYLIDLIKTYKKGKYLLTRAEKIRGSLNVGIFFEIVEGTLGTHWRVNTKLFSFCQEEFLPGLSPFLVEPISTCEMLNLEQNGDNYGF